MEHGGEDDDRQEEGFLGLVAKDAAAEVPSDEAPREGEQMKNELRHAPPSRAALPLVVAIEEEGHDARAEEPEGVEGEPFSAPLPQDGGRDGDGQGGNDEEKRAGGRLKKRFV